MNEKLAAPKPEEATTTHKALLAVRDALIAGDCEEAYHRLYWLADRGRNSLTPWDEWESGA